MSDSESSSEIICDEIVEGAETDEIICDEIVEGAETDEIICDEIVEGAETDEIICDEIVEGAETEGLNKLTKELSKIHIKISLKEELDKIAEKFIKEKIEYNIVAELIKSRELNFMVLDLHDYDKGYELSFCKHGSDVELWHGQYSYGMALIEYIRDGELPYEVLDKLLDYQYPIVYGGYAVCKIRIHFGKKDSLRSHFVLLKHSIQTIDGLCLMKLKENSSLKFDEERAKLIKLNSPDLCLDPDPAVAEIIVSNELNRRPFLTPFLKHIIHNERARREKGIQLMKKPKPQKSVPKIAKKEDWSFRLSIPTEEEVELSKLGSSLEYEDSLKPYLKDRPICFPDEKSLTGFQVEIENFVFEYYGKTRKGCVERIIDKFCISVLDDKEYYYGAFRLDEKETTKRIESSCWWGIGGREELDIHVNAFAREEIKLSYDGGMKITHNRMFNEQSEFSDGKIRILRRKLEVPVNKVIFELSPPPQQVEDEGEEMEEG